MSFHRFFDQLVKPNVQHGTCLHRPKLPYAISTTKCNCLGQSQTSRQGHMINGNKKD